jgi:peptidoglycan/xylan/chitin deacetylase (PgdA/CDA1 family)
MEPRGGYGRTETETAASMRSAIVLALCLLLPPQTAFALDDLVWPTGVSGAVCLTYDDGLDSHLDFAAPDLEATNLRGTFYVTGHSESLKTRLNEWRELARGGHEIGNHSLFHPCLGIANGERREWVSPERDLRSYTVREIVEELRTANTLLTAVDGRTRRSYAYTCTDETAGGKSYVAEVKSLFPSARVGGASLSTAAAGAGSPDPSNIRSLDLHRVPSWMVVDTTADEMIAFVEQVAGAGGLAVLMFHGIEADYLTVARREHRRLLEYLDENRDRLWTDTFLTVTDYLAEERERIGR